MLPNTLTLPVCVGFLGLLFGRDAQCYQKKRDYLVAAISLTFWTAR